MRSTNSVARHNKNKKIMKKVRGFYGARHKQLRMAKQSIKRAENAAFAGRKEKKRDYRKLWITRINIAARANGLSYSRFIAGLNHANITLDRKQLSELAIHEPEAFAAIVEQAKSALAAAA